MTTTSDLKAGTAAISTPPAPIQKPGSEASSQATPPVQKPVEPVDFTFHPLAEKFPLMEGDDLQRLADDIAARGLQMPIVTYEGKILDGRNRYRAAKLSAHKFAPTDFRPLSVGANPEAYVIVRRQNISDIRFGNLREYLAHLV
jgi:hypothetical protein